MFLTVPARSPVDWTSEDKVDQTSLVPQMATARSVIILDVGMYTLQSALEARNFKVYKLEAGLNEDIVSMMLAHRILVTSHSPTALREKAAIHEFSIIVVPQTRLARGPLALQISEAFTELTLKRSQPFLLELHVDGERRLLPIE
jgi:hypothetical protein